MDSNLQQYKTNADEALAYYGLSTKDSLGYAIHSVSYDYVRKTYDYSCTGIDALFMKMLNIEGKALDCIRYDTIFPENKENKFDWSALIGHIGTYQSKSKYYCFSEPLKRWYRFVAFSPVKGKAILILEDITTEKELEIAENIKKSAGSAKEQE
jgi:hypothetical protein